MGFFAGKVLVGVDFGWNKMVPASSKLTPKLGWNFLSNSPIPQAPRFCDRTSEVNIGSKW